MQDQAAHGGSVRGVLRHAVAAQERLSVAHAARRVFKVAHGLSAFFQVSKPDQDDLAALCAGRQGHARRDSTNRQRNGLRTNRHQAVGVRRPAMARD